MKFSVATQWNLNETLELLSIFNEKNVLNDIYGALTFSPIGHGRSPYSVPNIDIEKAQKYIHGIQEKGINFNYLLNGNFDSKKLNDPEFKKSVLEYLEVIFGELNVKYVTVAVPELVEIINKLYPLVSIKLSTINNILSVKDLKRFEKLKFDRVTLGNDAPHNIDDLKEMISYSKIKGIELELMISETCLHKCSFRSIHYRKQTETKSDFSTDWYMNNCTFLRIMNPEEIFKASWIRPENLEYYKKLGIRNFKISGRSKTPEWTRRCLQAYINRYYSGNIMDILGTTPPNFENNCEHLFSIDNRELDDFFNNHPLNCNRLNCKECGYCKETALNLFNKGAFKLNKILGEYSVINDKFSCLPGDYTKTLYKLLESKKGI